MSYRYFLKAPLVNDEWVEVSRQKWIEAERSAGFWPRMSKDDPRFMEVTATGGFTGGGISGKIEFVDDGEDD